MDRPRRPLHSHDNHIYPENTGQQYIKLGLFIVGVLLISFVLTFGRGWGIKYIWLDFMAVYLLISAAYKIFRLEIFVKIFQSFDFIAMRWPAWSYIFPFVELMLGADFLLSNGSPLFYLLTILVMGATAVNVLLEPKQKTHIQFACLDTMIRLPLFSLIVVDGIIMTLLALIMLIFY